MRLGRISTTLRNEAEMQQLFSQWCVERKLHHIAEFSVKEVNRRADFLLLNDNQLINVEAKCQGLEEMMCQLDDHAKYCDYTFGLIADYVLTPKWFKKRLLEGNHGLMVLNHKGNFITEVLEAHKHTYNDKVLRTNVIYRYNSKKNVQTGS